MKDKHGKNPCKNIFKSDSNSGEKFSILWAEVINHLEYSNFNSAIEPVIEKEYNGQVRACQSKNGEVSGK